MPKHKSEDYPLEPDSILKYYSIKYFNTINLLTIYNFIVRLVKCLWHIYVS